MAETIRVVIVDDERLFAELLRVALRAAEGIEVLAVVHDVKSAIVALNEHRPDVVIADYHLPDGTGADLARAVRGTLPDTSVLVLTADPSAGALENGARPRAGRVKPQGGRPAEGGGSVPPAGHRERPVPGRGTPT